MKDSEKREKINPPHGLYSFLLPLARFSHFSAYLVRAENVGCNNFATAGNDRAFRPLNMQWKLLLRDRRRSHVKGTDEIAEKAPMFRRFRAECPRYVPPRFASIAVFAFSSGYRLSYYAIAYRDIEITQYKCGFDSSI